MISAPLLALVMGLAPDAAAAPDAEVRDASAEAPTRADAGAAPAPSGTIERLVLERGTRRPLPGAVLTLDLAPAGETDGQGRLVLTAPCGPHRLIIQHPGFEAATLEIDPCLPAPPAPVRLQRRGLVYETVVRSSSPHQQVRLEDDELIKIPGTMGDPLRAIESLPGVSAVTWPAAVYAVRGANPGNTGFFLDDVRIPALFHLALGPSVIHPYFFQGMDFYPGGYPARYGRYVGGLVSAQTRPPEPEGVHAAADVRLVDAGALVSTPFPDGHGAVALAARYSYSGAMVSLLSDEVRLGYWDYQLRADRSLGPVRLTLLLFGASDRLSPSLSQPDRDIRLRFHRASLRAQVPAGRGTVLSSVSLGYDHSQAPLADRFPVEVTAWSVAPRAAYQRRSEYLDLELGADGELTRYQPISGVERPGLMDLARRRDAVLAAGYASATVKAGPLALTPELRLDSYTVGSARALSLGPRLSGRLAISEQSWIHVTGGRFTQTPSIPLQVPGVETFGLTLYGLQTSWQGSLGVGTTRLPNLEADLTAYVQRYRLTDVREPRIEHFDPLYDDFLVPREALSYGLELMLRRPQRERLHGWISYSLSRSLRAIGGGVIAPSDWDQRHVLNLVAGYRLGRNTLGGRIHFNSGRPFLTGDLRSADLERLPPFYQLDLRADRRFVFDAFILEAYVELANATLTRQVYGLGPGDGVTRNQNSFRLVIPSLGVHGEF